MQTQNNRPAAAGPPRPATPAARAPVPSPLTPAELRRLVAGMMD